METRTRADAEPTSFLKPDSESEQRLKQPRVACVIDLDNICHRGFDKNTGLARPQAEIDLDRFSWALHLRGVERGTAFRHFFPRETMGPWAPTKLALRATYENCDDAVVRAAVGYAAGGVKWLVLVGGDGDYVPMIKVAKSFGTSVEVWACQSRASRALLAAANRVRFIDDLFIAAVPKIRPDASAGSNQLCKSAA